MSEYVRGDSMPEDDTSADEQSIEGREDVATDDGGYELVDPENVEHGVSGKSETEQVDLTGRLALEEMRARVWYLEPGHDRKGTHVHERQEELYYAIDGTGTLTIDGERVEVPEGAFVRLPPSTPRRLFNDTDQEQVWLIVGAPPIADDGQQLGEW